VKLNWIAKSTVVTAVLYPASLIVSRRSSGVTDGVLVFVMLVLIAFLIALLAEQARLNAPLNNKLLMPGVTTALIGNVFLGHLIDKPSQPLTILMGAAFTVQLLAVASIVWREKSKNNHNTRTL